ncbi:hypothetical protein LAZ67_X004357 [Cordylochernes scorpioides]|uniref:DUF5641 domain-containing protein n=1 Tax=Cordylochernes scorpioides TaxID=51811 RepID=A0ABY6LV70_9ARAC|nr:hypothetical protein LAZ67_X004357 [Cordylochernes scorpioides]
MRAFTVRAYWICNSEGISLLGGYGRRDSLWNNGDSLRDVDQTTDQVTANKPQRSQPATKDQRADGLLISLLFISVLLKCLNKVSLKETFTLSFLLFCDLTKILTTANKRIITANFLYRFSHRCFLKHSPDFSPQNDFPGWASDKARSSGLNDGVLSSTPIPIENIERNNREVIEETYSELLMIQGKIRDFMLTSDVSEEELEHDDEGKELMKAWQRSPLHDVKIDANDSIQTRVDLIMEFLQKEAVAEQDRTLEGFKFGLKSLKQDRNMGRQSHPAKIPTASGIFAGRAQNYIFLQNGVSFPGLGASSLILLQTLKIKVEGVTSAKVVRALLGTGSQRFYILYKTAQNLELSPIGQESLKHVVFGGHTSESVHQEYRVNLGNASGNFKIVAKLLDQQNLGCDVLGSIFMMKSCVLSNGLTASQTGFGWTSMGECQPSSDVSLAHHVTTTTISESSITNLWNLDVFDIMDPIGVKQRDQRDALARRHFLKTVQHSVSGRYVVSLPWTVEKARIADNREDYDDIFRGWLADGIIEKVPAEQDDAEAFYMPHRPVVKLSSGTTPIRPVFNASSKTLRKRFLQIEVNERDRDYLRFLWYSRNGENTEVFRHRRVVFGVNCSPFILGAVIEYRLSNVRPEHKSLAQRLQKYFYVYNLFTSVKSFEELQDLRLTATSIMENARMEHSLDVASYTYPFERAEMSKVLGICWGKREDCLSCEIPVTIPLKITKRSTLSCLAEIYAPIGFLSPILIKPKILLQKAWTLKLAWNDELDRHYKDELSLWFDDLQLHKGMAIPRNFNPLMVFQKDWPIHTFVDVSSEAYAAVVFLRKRDAHKVEVHMMADKSRVAPIERSTIPRLELLACVVGARLNKMISEVLELKNVTNILWSDAKTALVWIKRDDQWEICRLSDPGDWRYVPSECNPADLPFSLSQLIKGSDEWKTHDLCQGLYELSCDTITFHVSTRTDRCQVSRVGLNQTTQKLRYLNKLREEFKSRFRKIYLSLLVQRNGRIYNKKKNIQAGDVVLIGIDNKKHNFWPLAVIEKVLFGRDGVNRLVKVRISVGTLLIPIQRIYPLEISSTAVSSRLLNDKKKTANIQTRSGKTRKTVWGEMWNNGDPLREVGQPATKDQRAAWRKEIIQERVVAK